MDMSQLPQAVQAHLPNGYQLSEGVWLVLPASNDTDQSISRVNEWLRVEDWYPDSLQSIIWFGDDGIGNMLGWNTSSSQAILWNPEDGEEPWRMGTVEELWSFITGGYEV